MLEESSCAASSSAESLGAPEGQTPTGPAILKAERRTKPRWARSSNELFFLSKTQLMSVKFSPGGALNPGKPTLLFEDKKAWSGYDVAPDGRFVVAREAEDKPTGNQINVVLRWFDELKRAQRK